MFVTFCTVCFLLGWYAWKASGNTAKSFFFTAATGLCALAALFWAGEQGFPIVVTTPLFLGASVLLGIPGVIGVLLLRILGIF